MAALTRLIENGKGAYDQKKDDQDLLASHSDCFFYWHNAGNDQISNARLQLQSLQDPSLQKGLTQVLKEIHRKQASLLSSFNIWLKNFIASDKNLANFIGDGAVSPSYKPLFDCADSLFYLAFAHLSDVSAFASLGDDNNVKENANFALMQNMIKDVVMSDFKDYLPVVFPVIEGLLQERQVDFNKLDQAARTFDSVFFLRHSADNNINVLYQYCQTIDSEYERSKLVAHLRFTKSAEGSDELNQHKIELLANLAKLHLNIESNNVFFQTMIKALFHFVLTQINKLDQDDINHFNDSLLEAIKGNNFSDVSAARAQLINVIGEQNNELCDVINSSFKKYIAANVIQFVNDQEQAVQQLMEADPNYRAHTNDSDGTIHLFSNTADKVKQVMAASPKTFWQKLTDEIKVEVNDPFRKNLITKLQALACQEPGLDQTKCVAIAQLYFDCLTKEKSTLLIDMMNGSVERSSYKPVEGIVDELDKFARHTEFRTKLTDRIDALTSVSTDEDVTKKNYATLSAAEAAGEPVKLSLTDAKIHCLTVLRDSLKGDASFAGDLTRIIQDWKNVLPENLQIVANEEIKNNFDLVNEPREYVSLLKTWGMFKSGMSKLGLAEPYKTATAEMVEEPLQNGFGK